MLKELIMVASGLGALVTIHQSVKYFSKQVPAPKHKTYYTYQKPVIKLYANTTHTTINKPITFSGSVTIPGIVDIYSADLKELSVYPHKGKFFAILYFTKKGVYEIYAKIANHESNNILIRVS